MIPPSGPEQEFLLRAAVEASATGVMVVDPRGRIVLVNREIERLFGFTREELLGLPVDMLVPPHARLAYKALFSGLVQKHWADPAGAARVIQGLRKDGAETPIEIGLTPVQAEPSRLMVVSVVDIRERQAVEQALRQSEAQYRILFETNPNPMWVYDLVTLAFLAVNHAATYQYGYSREEFLAMTIKDIRPPEDVPQLLEEVSRPNPEPLLPAIWRHRRKDGTLIDVEISSAAMVFGGRPAELILAHDVTQRKRLEEQFRQAQKMEAIGRLAGGIAHDFNNILSAIMSYTDLVKAEMPEGSTQRADLEEIARSAVRAAELTHQILAFSRQQILEPRVLDLNKTVGGLDRMLGRIIGEDIVLEARLDSNLGRIKADPGQLEQVIMNLVVNARDAMPDGGRLTIETTNIALDEVAAGHSGLEPGRYVQLALTDTGCGMTRDQMSRIFEPFFTTKEQSKGTGLGLSTVYGIVKQSGGHVWAYSEPNRGTTFKIYLPRVDDALQEAIAQSAAVAPGRGTETILLVEDDDAVRRAAGRILERNGYTVLPTEAAEQARLVCLEYAGPIDLVLSDVVMPGMSGFDLVRLALELRPTIRVLLMSGYTESNIRQRRDLPAGVAYLEKPFTATLLTRKVRDVLDGS